MTDPVIDEKRYKFLKYLYDKDKSDPDFILRKYDDLIIATQIDKSEIHFIQRYLQEEGLVFNDMDDGLFLSITHKGIKIIENYQKNPKIYSPKPESKISIFISHISEERLIARYLKDLLIEAFENKISVFVSSDLNSISKGKEWFKEIKENLQKSEYVLVLCSNDSVMRPWINFEAGAAHLLDKHVVPVCYHGVSLGNLPQPLSNLQAIEAKNLPIFKSLIEQIGEDCNIKPQTVVIQKSSFFGIIKSDPKTGFIQVQYQNGGNFQRGEVMEIVGDLYPPKSEKITIQLFGPDSINTMLESETIEYFDGRILYQYSTNNLKEGNYYISFTMRSGGSTKLSFHIDDEEEKDCGD